MHSNLCQSAESERREMETTLYAVVSDIREAAGVGARPMLDEIATEIRAIREERDRLRSENEKLSAMLQHAANEVVRLQSKLGPDA